VLHIPVVRHPFEVVDVVVARVVINVIHLKLLPTLDRAVGAEHEAVNEESSLHTVYGRAHRLVP
jgi:hypothetical protein